jgi:hypothetical protein
MRKIEILTFKGCQTAVELAQKLTEMIKDNLLEAEVITTVVPTLEEAQVKGLNGSPTIKIDGEEYQKQIMAKPGFY